MRLGLGWDVGGLSCGRGLGAKAGLGPTPYLGDQRVSRNTRAYSLAGEDRLRKIYKLSPHDCLPTTQSPGPTQSPHLIEGHAGVLEGDVTQRDIGAEGDAEEVDEALASRV